MFEGRTARLDLVLAAALTAAVFVVFSPGLFGPFLWDDIALIPTNPMVRSLSHYRVWFVSDFWDVSTELGPLGDHIHYYRPLVIASFALEWKLAGDNPLVFHLTNLVLHAAVAVLAFRTLQRWSGRSAAAAIAAAFFALHPTKSESVAWIVGRTDVMCTLAMLVVCAGVARRRSGARYGLALEIVGTIIAYLTKEMAVMIGVLVAVEEWVALGRPPIETSTLRKMARASAPYFAVAVVYLVLRARLMPMQSTSPHMPLGDHVQFVLESVGRYVALAAFIHPLSSQIALLRSFDGRWVHAPGYVAVGALAIVGALVLAGMTRRRAPAIAVGIGLFFVLLLPVSNLVVTGLSTTVAERFLYAPLLGVALVVAALLDLDRAGAAPRAPIIVAVVVVVLSSGRAFVRAIDFSDERIFWARERELHPESLEAHRFAFLHARKSLHYRDAARIALEAREQAARWYRHNGAEVEFVQAYLEAQAYLTPDRRIADLQGIDAFFTALLDPTASSASAKTSQFSLSIDITRPIRRYTETMRVRVMVAHSQVLSRIGEDGLAVRVIDDANKICAACVATAIAGALAAARAGDYPRAYAFLDRCAAARGELVVADQRATIDAASLARRQSDATSGPVALNLRAEELSRLEAWGRAYAVLAPYREQIALAPGFALGFAELAYRAGEPTVAREVLGQHLPAEKIEPTVALWGRKMGWVD